MLFMECTLLTRVEKEVEEKNRCVVFICISFPEPEQSWWNMENGCRARGRERERDEEVY